MAMPVMRVMPMSMSRPIHTTGIAVDGEAPGAGAGRHNFIAFAATVALRNAVVAMSLHGQFLAWVVALGLPLTMSVLPICAVPRGSPHAAVGRSMIWSMTRGMMGVGVPTWCMRLFTRMPRQSVAVPVPAAVGVAMIMLAMAELSIMLTRILIKRSRRWGCVILLHGITSSSTSLILVTTNPESCILSCSSIRDGALPSAWHCCIILDTLGIERLCCRSCSLRIKSKFQPKAELFAWIHVKHLLVHHLLLLLPHATGSSILINAFRSMLADSRVVMRIDRLRLMDPESIRRPAIQRRC